jgi:hypothetical protein
MRQFATVIGLALVILAQVGCRGKVTDEEKKAADEARSAKEAAAAPEEDRNSEQVIAGKDKDEIAAEARDWLDPKHTNHAAWKIDKKRMLEMTEALYAAGASKVYAVSMRPDDTFKAEICAQLLVVLPSGKADREKVIDACQKIEKQVWGGDADKIRDVGQKYVRLNLDA